MALDGLSQMFERTDSVANPVAADLEQRFSPGSSDVVSNAGATNPDEVAYTQIGNVSETATDATDIEYEGGDAEVSYIEAVMPRTGSDWNEEAPSLFAVASERAQQSCSEASASPTEQPEVAALPDVRTRVETVTSETPDIGKAAVKLWEDTPGVSTESPSFADALGYTDTYDTHIEHREIVPIEVDHSSLAPSETDTTPHTKDLGKNMLEAIGAYYDPDRIMGKEAGDSADTPAKHEQPERGDTPKLHRIEITGIGETRDNTAIAARKASDQSAIVNATPQERRTVETRPAHAPQSAAYPENQSPISTPSRFMPRWRQDLIERHGDLPLPTLVQTEARARQHFARETQRERMYELFHGLPSFFFRFPSWREELARRHGMMKEQDELDKERMKILRQRAQASR